MELLNGCEPGIVRPYINGPRERNTLAEQGRLECGPEPHIRRDHRRRLRTVKTESRKRAGTLPNVPFDRM
jgi:hypothetical protein